MLLYYTGFSEKNPYNFKISFKKMINSKVKLGRQKGLNKSNGFSAALIYLNMKLFRSTTKMKMIFQLKLQSFHNAKIDGIYSCLDILFRFHYLIL